MTCLNRTDLAIPQKIQCSTQALLAQHQGGISALSRELGISRPTLYAVADTVESLLAHHFSQGSIAPATVLVDKAQLQRAAIALRVIAPNSIRAIEELIPLLYPGQSASFGTIQSWLSQAEIQAGHFNTQVDLSAITTAALDELFSQGKPVLAGIDLDSGYLFNLEVSDSRSGEDWKRFLSLVKEQGANLDVVVKDAAKGIASGVRQVFPEAEQRDDSFHALYELGKVWHRLEQKAYAAITAEEAALNKLGKIRAKDKQQRKVAYKKLRLVQQGCQQRLDEFERFEQAAQQITQALQWVDLQTGQWQTAEQIQTTIYQATETIRQIDQRDCRAVANYLHNRAPGLALYAEALDQQLQALKTTYPESAIALACVIIQLAHYLKQGAHRYSPRQRLLFQQQSLGAWHLLHQQLPKPIVNTLLDDIQAMWKQRHRASSAIEGFNSALRPFLYVQKCANQGFLNLFRAYFNLRKRRNGRHKGSSAYGKISDSAVSDWLTLLGYPPTVPA